MSRLLDVRNLSISHGKVEAVRQLDLCLEEGQIVSLIGPNGAGKTTLMAALIGLLPSQGQVTYAGQPLLAHHDVAQRIDKGMALVPESRELFGLMSVEDNLRLGAFSRHRRGFRDHQNTLDEVFGLFPRMYERRHQQACTLSGGERQMLAIGRALMAKPRLLMLDEPSLGLAPRVIGEIFTIFETLRQSGVSILLVEQNARAALKISDYGYVLEVGEIVLEGSAQALANNPQVAEIYLGRSPAQTTTEVPRATGT
ncbi:amino acid/amide ABC transporter ATP-binding protein 2, HAAT family [Pseudomonas extremaustralis]|jgi:branched-chain amino acid transport system ATP-binding protein|uniref:ABC transporter ATP-binding protein n=1 Tax=Pseudomonas extremaustralis TaxID=359110 RepID=A0A5C5Q3X3_9PSED|nr:metal-dependent hydrolase [Pseudomonas extremaustralis 14-3 substr. 14-3b]TWS00329.1 ABC transporter ATP-binding protein [Pseudomonas extremaustralis]SDF22791.1 amino acid/amide ABC transporter ATP-binding protein 2, HAAT family [Pseudomonas extremaustralis]